MLRNKGHTEFWSNFKLFLNLLNTYDEVYIMSGVSGKVEPVYVKPSKQPSGVLKIWSKFTEEYPCQSVISIKLENNFIEITLRQGCSHVKWLHIFRTPFPKNRSCRLFLSIYILYKWLFELFLQKTGWNANRSWCFCENIVKYGTSCKFLPSTTMALVFSNYSSLNMCHLLNPFLVSFSFWTFWVTST